MKKIFLDTNIILDFLDKKRALHKDAKLLIQKLIIENYDIYISEDMISTIYYVGKDKEKILNFFKTIINRWSVVPFGTELILEAVEICQKNPTQDLEDTLQCLCAKRYDCKYIVTFDKNFIDCGIKVINYLEIEEIG